MKQKPNRRPRSKNLVIGVFCMGCFLLIVGLYLPGTSSFAIWAYYRVLHGSALDYKGWELHLSRYQAFYAAEGEPLAVIARRNVFRSSDVGYFWVVENEMESDISDYIHMANEEYCVLNDCRWNMERFGEQVVYSFVFESDRKDLQLHYFPACPWRIRVETDWLDSFSNLLLAWEIECSRVLGRVRLID